MRPKYIPDIIVGILLIYVSLYGVSGFADFVPFQLALTGDILKEDWNSLGGWLSSEGSVTVVDGLLVQKGNPRARVTLRNSPDPPSQFTVEIKTKVDYWPTEGTETYLRFDIYFNGGSKLYHLVIWQNQVQVSSGQPTSLVTDTNWHVWTLTIDQTAPQAKLYRDSALVATWDVGSRAGSATYSRYVFGPLGGIEMSTDYLYIDNGLKPPDGSPPPSGTGTLKVYTYVDSQQTPPDNNVIIVNGATYYTDNTGYWSQDVQPAQYTVSATYQGETKTDTQTVNQGQVTTVQLSWGGTPPPPDGDGDFFEEILRVIDGFLANRTIKSALFMVGAALVGIGALMFIMPGQSRPRFGPY